MEFKITLFILIIILEMIILVKIQCDKISYIISMKKEFEVKYDIAGDKFFSYIIDMHHHDKVCDEILCKYGKFIWINIAISVLFIAIDLFVLLYVFY